MLTKSLLAIVLAACGVQSTPATAEPPAEQPDKRPPTPPVEPLDHYFCCDTLDGKGGGDGCEEILQSHVVLCGKVLYCDKGYSNDDGKVKCLD